MVFGFFKKQARQNPLTGDLANLIAFREMSLKIEKAGNLTKLGRTIDAQQLLREAESLVLDYLKNNERSLQAHMLVAILYSEVGKPDKAIAALEQILVPGRFPIPEQMKAILEGELLTLRRQRPAQARSAEDAAFGYTTIYSCQNCGRLINYITMPCAHCQWSPQSLDEMARSVVLSNVKFKVRSLLLLAREINRGRSANDVVPNLMSDGRAYLQKARPTVENLLKVLQANSAQTSRDLHMLRQCSDCGKRILASHSDQCEQCNAPVRWPPALRLLACMDNLLLLFEQRVEASSTTAFSEFVCLLVLMTNNLLRKQENPTTEQRQYALDLLKEEKVITDKNKGGAVDTRNPEALQIYIFKDTQLDDTQTYVTFLWHELDQFVKGMVSVPAR